ncbi:MAG: prolipoprotein diacylglyceryl transferase [Proteobacteria bacterium]|nr:prolipoprotein diacylglyceryl transferase [Pseudomonadota bacterium]
MFALAFPTIDPTLIEIGPFAIRWYALAYIGGILLGWRYALVLARTSPYPFERRTLDDFLLWVTLGIVLGGRLGYVLFYKPGYFLEHPAEIVFVWQGGMAFHGGMLGVAIGIVVFARLRRIPLLALGDLVACVVPIGLFLGRIANFINGELFGRVSDVPWAMVFPRGGDLPRHPSQLYEAGLEGLVLFCLLWLLWRHSSLKQRPGAISGVFLAGYGLSRFVVEFAREPDAHLGFLFAGATMGQLLSVPMVLLGLGLILWARPLPPEQRAAAAPEKKPAPRAKGAAKARTKGKSGRR